MVSHCAFYLHFCVWMMVRFFSDQVASLVALVKRILLTMQEMQETQVWSLGWEDSLEEEMATHSSILAWKILQTEEPGGLESLGSDTTERAHTHAHTHTHTHIQILFSPYRPFVYLFWKWYSSPVFSFSLDCLIVELSVFFKYYRYNFFYQIFDL